jgi:hypothetical protein
MRYDRIVKGSLWFAGSWALVTIGLPLLLFIAGFYDGVVAAWGAFIGAFAVGVVGALALPQLMLMKASTEADVFLKVCGIIEDPKFTDGYDTVRRKKDYLKGAELTPGGALSGTDAATSDKVLHVLDAMEKVGIIFYYATNKGMISEYIGDDVIKLHNILAKVIEENRNLANDATMYERFTGMYEYCDKAWGDTTPVNKGASSEPSTGT